MAEFPETNLNASLIAAGLNPSSPTSTYVDFADQMARNQQQQAAQEQAIARAKELTAQAQLQTTQETQAANAGYNPQLADTMTPEEAVAYLKIILKEKGLTVSEDDIDTWASTLPQRVNRQIVETFASRFARQTNRLGQAVKFTTDQNIAIPEGKTAQDLGLVADEDNPAIGHVPDDGMYQVAVDNQGTVQRFIPGGKEATDKSATNALKLSEDTEKQWQKLDTTVNGAFKTRSGGLGSLSTAIFRAVRAINTINTQPNLAAQDLANISQDIAGVFQGGAPTVVGVQDNDYRTALTDLENSFRKYTGVMGAGQKLFGTGGLDEMRDKLLSVLVDLRDSAINNLKFFVESEEPAYKSIIDADPDRWKTFQDKKLQFIESGILIPPGANTTLNITGGKEAATTKRAVPVTNSKRVVPKYTVED